MPSSTVNPLVVTVAQAAELLGLSRAKIYLLIDAGDLRRVKIGRATRIPFSDIEALIDAGIGG